MKLGSFFTNPPKLLNNQGLFCLSSLGVTTSPRRQVHGCNIDDSCTAEAWAPSFGAKHLGKSFSSWWFQFFSCSPLPGEMIQFD